MGDFHNNWIIEKFGEKFVRIIRERINSDFNHVLFVKYYNLRVFSLDFPIKIYLS